MSGSRWLPVGVWVGVILTATSIPNVPGPPVAGSDKVVHLAMYAVLGALALRAARNHDAPSRTLVVVLTAIALFAAADEWHQQFIPSRSADVADWVADVTGAALGTGAVALLNFRRIKGT